MFKNKITKIFSFLLVAVLLMGCGDKPVTEVKMIKVTLTDK